MTLKKIDIRLCKECNNYRGSVAEKYNGNVPVYCACQVEEERVKYGYCKTLCLLCPDGDKFWWKPISNHKEADGKMWHTPYLYGPRLNK